MKQQLLLHEGDSKLVYTPDYLPKVEISDLLHGVELRQNQIAVFGKQHLEPRLTAWFGPAYRYANIQWDASNFPPHLEHMCSNVSDFCKFAFNSVLINFYRNGDDSMGWHRDNEKELDHQFIASLSFGSSRTFKVRDRATKTSLNIELEHGSLLIMENMQINYEHALPKRTKLNSPRLNLTFRRIRS